ncbi:Fic family protein [Pseudactinotalea sp. HY158]|nr:Fic family protein [Pseudactinotalea sp. HY158]
MLKRPSDEPLPVPATGDEEHEWLAEPDGMTSRARLRAGSGPYSSSVPPSLIDYRPAIPADLTAEIEEAATDLTRFDRYAAATLGASSPTLGPMSAVLLRSESSSSSQIENLTVSARQLAMAEVDQSTSANAALVVANVRAMEAALDLADRLDVDAILRMHAALMTRQPGWEDHAGRFRRQLVWIGTSSVSPRGAAHVAPQPELVPGAIADLMHFVDRADLPVIAQAAIAHAQFETIHPFTDGNGRTGRALVHAMLRAAGILQSTTAPISAGLLTDTAGYFDALTSFREGDARPIVERFALAGRYAATTGTRLIDDLAGQIDAARDMLAGLRTNASAWSVLPHLIAHPVVTSTFLVTRLGLNEVTAQRALGQLTERGVLAERTGFRRNRVWQHDGILGVLEDYGQRLHRSG